MHADNAVVEDLLTMLVKFKGSGKFFTGFLFLHEMALNKEGDADLVNLCINKLKKTYVIRVSAF